MPEDPEPPTRKQGPRATTLPSSATSKTGAARAISNQGMRDNPTTEAQHHQGDGLGTSHQHVARGKAPKQANPERAITNCRPSPFGDNAAASKTPALQNDTSQICPNLARPTQYCPATAPEYPP